MKELMVVTNLQVVVAQAPTAQSKKNNPKSGTVSNSLERNSCACMESKIVVGILPITQASTMLSR